MGKPQCPDWRTSNLLRDVDTQKGCGSCWAHAATHTLQDRQSIAANKSYVDIAIQQVLDCTYPPLYDGCNGGGAGTAMKYMLNKGVSSEADYGPYTATDGKCQEIDAGNPGNEYTFPDLNKVTGFGGAGGLLKTRHLVRAPFVHVSLLVAWSRSLCAPHQV